MVRRREPQPALPPDVNLLLDTCTLLWWVGGDAVSAEAAEAIADPDNGVWVSVASIWEISIKRSIGKLTVSGDLDAVVDEDFEHLPIIAAHARLAGRLPAITAIPSTGCSWPKRRRRA